MFKKLLKKDQGFTLIEVVLVLAIAALIILIVLLAVGGAQKTRRDTQRKSALGAMAAQLENYASNNTGQYPSSQANFATMAGTYMTGNQFNDPLSGSIYNFAGSQAPSSSNSAGVTYTIAGRVYTICINLEVGGTNCQTNQ